MRAPLARARIPRVPFSFLRKKKPLQFTREQSLAAKPFKNPNVKWEKTETGEAVLEFPVKLPRRIRFAAWLIGKDSGETATRKLELDEVGSFIWEACDSRTTVSDLIRKVAKAYKLPRKESEHSTTLFLKMLAERGVLLMDVSEALEGKEKGEVSPRRQGR